MSIISTLKLTDQTEVEVVPEFDYQNNKKTFLILDEDEPQFLMKKEQEPFMQKVPAFPGCTWAGT